MWQELKEKAPPEATKTMTCFWIYGQQEGFGLAELCGNWPIHSEREPKLTYGAPTAWDTCGLLDRIPKKEREGAMDLTREFKRQSDLRTKQSED